MRYSAWCFTPHSVHSVDQLELFIRSRIWSATVTSVRRLRIYYRVNMIGDGGLNSLFLFSWKEFLNRLFTCQRSNTMLWCACRWPPQHQRRLLSTMASPCRILSIFIFLLLLFSSHFSDIFCIINSFIYFHINYQGSRLSKLLSSLFLFPPLSIFGPRSFIRLRSPSHRTYLIDEPGWAGSFLIDTDEGREGGRNLNLRLLELISHAGRKSEVKEAFGDGFLWCNHVSRTR